MREPHPLFVCQHTQLARRLLDRQDLMTAVIDQPLAIIDIVREYLRPAAGDDFADMVTSERGVHVLATLGALAPDNELSIQLMIAWQVVRHQLAGDRTYTVGSGLGRRLLATEMRGVRCEDLRLPYPSIYVLVDPSLGFRVYNEHTGMHPLYGAYVTEDAGGWRLLLCGLGSGDDDALSHFHVRLQEGLVDDELARLRAYVVDHDARWAMGAGDVDLSVLVEDWFAVFRWLMNLIFYVTHVEPGDHVETNMDLSRLRGRAHRAGGKKRERLLARARDLPSRRHIVVGARVSGRGMPANTGQARTLLTRTLVAGHWQRFAVGVGRVDRVWKFREPFWRGRGPEGPSVHEVR